MKMKRILLIALAVFMCTSLIASGSSESKEEKPTVTYWYWEDIQGKHVEMLADRWKEYTDDIELILEPIPAGNFHDRLITAVSSGTAPDVFQMYTDWIPELVGLGALEDLTGKFDDWEYIDEVPDYMIDLAYAGYDRMYTFPRSVLTMYLYCRTDYFEEIGMDYPKTMDEFYEAAEKLTRDLDGDGVIDTYGFGMRGATNGHSMWSSLVFNAKPGFDYFDEDGNAQLMDPAIIEANQNYIDMYKNGWAPPTAPTDGFNEILQNFRAGVTGMLYHHVGSSKTVTESLGDNVVAVPLPAGEGGVFGVQEVTNFGIYSGSKNKEAALIFLKWINSPEIQSVICEELQQVPWLESVQKMDKFQDNVFFKASIESLPDSHLLPITTTMSQFTNMAWPQNFQRALLGEITGEEMLQNLNDVLNGV